jgi:hypothetical protein
MRIIRLTKAMSKESVSHRRKHEDVMKKPGGPSPDETPRRLPPGPEWLKAEAHGFDMSLIELSLEKSPEERLNELFSFIELTEALRRAAKLR